jgi:hypothetical protein
MTPKDTAESHQESRSREYPNLERHYGSIGISAVAAAVRYHGDKNPAYAPAETRDDGDSKEAA